MLLTQKLQHFNESVQPKRDLLLEKQQHDVRVASGKPQQPFGQAFKSELAMAAHGSQAWKMAMLDLAMQYSK